MIQSMMDIPTTASRNFFQKPYRISTILEVKYQPKPVGQFIDALTYSRGQVVLRVVRTHRLGLGSISEDGGCAHLALVVVVEWLEK